MNNDANLLRCYVEEKSEAAFTDLVQRHVGLVYSVAFRRLGGDAHLAEDVAQKVFSDFARKAASLRERPTLSGWFYTSTLLASAAVVRSERRRKTRETEAHIMQNTLAPSKSDADWTHLRAAIDDAIVELRNEDREAVVLRFFEKRSFAEVGAALRVTDEAARKRVDRALGKLRAALTRRGVTSTAAALGLALAAMGTAAAPAELTAKIATHALTHVAAVAGGSIPGVLANALWPAAAALVVGGFFVGSQRQTNAQLRAELARLHADNHWATALREENRRLAQGIAQAEIGRDQTPLERPATAPRVAVPTPHTMRPVSASVRVSAQGTIAWNNQAITLEDFIALLQAHRASADPESRIHIQAPDASFPALSYVLDEVRKAELSHLTVESNASPDPKLGGTWF